MPQITQGRNSTPESSDIPTNERWRSSALQLGPRKRPTTQDPLVHRGRHFGRSVHAFCNVQTLVTNGFEYLIRIDENGDDGEDALTVVERNEYQAFQELLHLVPGLERQLMGSSEEETVAITDLIQKGANGALLCPAGLDWANTETRNKLVNGQIQVAGDQWRVFLYANYSYDLDDPWNGLLGVAYSSLSVSQEPKATRSGNARIHGMQSVTRASIAYVATQACFALTSAQVFSRTDLTTDSECFYNSILQLLEDPDEREVHQLLAWWNRQVFPLFSDIERLPLKNCVLARILQKRAEAMTRVESE